MLYPEKNYPIKLNFHSVLLSFIPKEYSPGDRKRGSLTSQRNCILKEILISLPWKTIH
ncbi:MAG: hypothetical protein ACXWFZ_07710 [Nitrososphaeraceae archaeon]